MKNAIPLFEQYQKKRQSVRANLQKILGYSTILSQTFQWQSL
jgi:hypothetical protein